MRWGVDEILSDVIECQSCNSESKLSYLPAITKQIHAITHIHARGVQMSLVYETAASANKGDIAKENVVYVATVQATYLLDCRAQQ